MGVREQTRRRLFANVSMRVGAALRSAGSYFLMRIEPGYTWRNRPLEIHTIEALEDSDVLEVKMSCVWWTTMGVRERTRRRLFADFSMRDGAALRSAGSYFLMRIEPGYT